MTRRALLILGLGIIILTLVDGIYSGVINSYATNKYDHSNNKEYNNEERLDGPLLTIIVDRFSATERLIDRHEHLLIVLSTIAIALFTGTLYRATSGLQNSAETQSRDMQDSISIAKESADSARRTVETMKDTAERQLRAHVFVESASITNVANPLPSFTNIPVPNPAALTYPNDGPMVYLQIKNFGNTPAYNVIHWANVHYSSFPLTVNLPRRQKTNPSALTKVMIGPGNINTKRIVMLTPLTAQQIADFRAGIAAIYVYGIIVYKDAFGKRRRTKYRMMHIEFAGRIGISTDLTGCQQGNDAT